MEKLDVFEKYESEVRSYCRIFNQQLDTAKGSIIKDVNGKEYIDFFCGAGALNYGHNNPYILRTNGDVQALTGITNCIVGVVDDYEYQDNLTTLNIGDTLVLYTDGVNEAFNPAFEEYGDSRLENALQQQKGKDCKQLTEALLEDVRTFAAGAPQSDDITIMSLKRKA